LYFLKEFRLPWYEPTGGDQRMYPLESSSIGSPGKPGVYLWIKILLFSVNGLNKLIEQANAGVAERQTRRP
ncbi:MAG: hypothetical protein WBC48_00720, partial [Minisyncoccales bacterium]